ncbi:MAG TPA: hypothetical protein VGQ41_24515 [Pyrinomonadaceae bacterium]|jgi:hypothetical protein|nr:hypothetical protein [Pyrinomonadaceae bacterium]
MKSFLSSHMTPTQRLLYAFFIHRYTKDPEKVRLLGAWRTEFKYNGWFSRTMVGLTLSSAEWKEPQRWEGMNLAFSFDTKEMSEKFDAAFRQAIRLCRSK